MELVWDARYDTGIEVIDQQHRELFKMVGRLRQLVVDAGERARVEALLEDLVARAGHHFATEETFMEKLGFPGLPQHRAEHVSMFGQLHELHARFQDSDQAVALMVPTFLEGWLKHHISEDDFGFMTFLQLANQA